MDKSINHDLWIKTGASTARATLKVFEHAFFGKWKIDVIVNSQKALILKLTRKVNSHHEIVLSGVIKKSKFDNGLEATVYLLHSDQLIDIGPLKLGGDFGFKISITGEWRLWETLGKYQLADVYVEWDKQSNIAENSLRLMHILVSKKDIALGGAAGAFAMISKWLLPLRPMVDNLFAELESLPVPPP
jgi:hypothetical protein